MTKRRGKRIVDEFDEIESEKLEAEPQADSEGVRIDSEPEELRPVRLLNTDVFDGCYLIYDVETREGYLVPTELLAYSTGVQTLPKRVLEAAKRPYDWSEEIERLIVDRQTLRLALWRSGLAAPQEINLRALVARLVMHGTLPVVGEK